MAFALVNKSSSPTFGDSVTSQSASTSWSVAAGNLIVCTVSMATGTDAASPAAAIPTPSGWTRAVHVEGIGTGDYKPCQAVFYKAASAGGTETASFTGLGGDTYIAIDFAEFSYSGTCVIDTSSTNATGSGTSLASGSITNTGANAVAIACGSFDQQIVTITGPGSPFTQLTLSNTNSTHCCHASGYVIRTSATATNDAYTSSGAAPGSSALVFFKETSGGTSVALTGQSMALAQGSFGLQESLALTGQAIGTAQGTLTPRESLALTGQSIGTAQGTLGVRESLGLTGQSIGAAQGSLGLQMSLGLTGQSIGIVQGSLGLQTSLSLGGQSLTVTQGDLGLAKSLALVGQPLVFAQGNLMAGGDVAMGLSGAGIVVQAGTVSPRLSLALSGQPAVLSQGTLSARIAAALGGQDLTFGSGSLTPVNSTPIGAALTGIGLQLSQGFVTPVGGQGSGSTALRRWAQQMYARYFEERDAKKLEEQARQIEANIIDRRPVPVPKKPKATVLVRPEPPVPVIQAFPWLKSEPTVPGIVMPDFKAQSAQIQSLLRQAQRPSPAPSDDEDEELLLMALI